MKPISKKETKKEKPRWVVFVLRVLFCIAIGIGGIALLLSPILILVGSSVFARVHETSNPSNYINVAWNNEKEASDFYDKWNINSPLFPAKLTEDMNVQQFKKVHYDPWDPNDLALLVVEYDDRAFQNEVKRLENYGSSTYLGVYGITGFRDWKLLAIDASDSNGVEYAITRNKGEVVYFQLRFCNYFSDIDYKQYVPAQYLPDGFDASEGNPVRAAFDAAFDEDSLDNWYNNNRNQTFAFVFDGKEFVECRDNDLQFGFEESERMITGWLVPQNAEQKKVELFFGKRDEKDTSPNTEGYAYSTKDLAMFLSLKPSGLLIEKDRIPDYSTGSEIEYLLFSEVYGIYDGEGFPKAKIAAKVTDIEDIKAVEDALKQALMTKDDKTVSLSGEKRFQIGIKYKGCGAIHWDRFVAMDKNGRPVLVKEAYASSDTEDAWLEERGCKLDDAVIDVFKKYSKQS